MAYNISLQNTSILYFFSRVLKHTFKFSFITVLNFLFYIKSRIFFSLINIIPVGSKNIIPSQILLGKEGKSIYPDYSIMYCHAQSLEPK